MTNDPMDKYDALDWALRRLGGAAAQRPHAELVEILSQALAITRTGGAGSRRQAADLILSAISQIKGKK